MIQMETIKCAPNVLSQHNVRGMEAGSSKDRQLKPAASAENGFSAQRWNHTLQPLWLWSVNVINNLVNTPKYKGWQNLAQNWANRPPQAKLDYLGAMLHKGKMEVIW